ncbi:MAG: thiolase family protein [Alphaproteobacteria bacterium]|nr:thiolase family protein [Alphaproteobacteria bacterium]
MSQAVIAGYVRSPFTPANRGALARVRPDDFAAQTIKGLIAKTGVKPEDVEDLLVGCAFPEGEQGYNLGRMLVFLSGLPETAGGVTINRWCGSSMEAIHMAAGKIATNSGKVFICAGVESMSRIPMGGYNLLPNPDLYQNHPEAYMSMGLTAENLAKKYNIDREAQEEFAVNSHKKALAGDLADEIIPIQTKNGVVDKDGCVRADTSAEALSALKPAFDASGTVTAGTSSPLTDGAVAVLVVSEDYAKENNLPILARIKSMAVDGIAPEIMGMGPVHASKKALSRAGVSLSDVDVVELNEAFAAQSLACIQEMGLDSAKVNMEGGAVALGHPLGASGARITGKAAKLLNDKGGKYALATMCIGGGQGIATVLEAV